MPTRRLLLACLAAASAAACTSPSALAVGSIVDVTVVDRSRNETLPTWRGRGASWVAGRPGDRYAVRLTNRSGNRVLVVLSVDGVNAVSGETASTGQTGYVLAPWQTTEITGWRKSWQEAAAFYFTSLPDSYAARTDRPDNVGVIGAAVFRERVAYVQPSPPPISRRYDDSYSRGRGEAQGAANESERRAEPNASADAAGPSGELSRQAPRSAAAPRESSPAFRDQAPAEAKKAEKLGTGHGEREYSPTTQTAFERATSNPAEVVQVRYDSYANLLAAGIIPRNPPTYGYANPFPGFAPDPH